jgi:hypothetical protein
VKEPTRALDNLPVGERPPGYKAIEYYLDGTTKRVETVPDDGKDV